MKNQELADFYGVSTQAVGRWSKERKHRKRVQALSGAEQPIVGLIADISKLVFIFNCKWLHGEKQVKNCHLSAYHSHLTVGFFAEGNPEPIILLEAWASDLNFEQKLYEIKDHLEVIVYGQVRFNTIA